MPILLFFYDGYFLGSCECINRKEFMENRIKPLLSAYEWHEKDLRTIRTFLGSTHVAFPSIGPMDP